MIFIRDYVKDFMQKRPAIQFEKQALVKYTVKTGSRILIIAHVGGTDKRP